MKDDAAAGWTIAAEAASTLVLKSCLCVAGLGSVLIPLSSVMAGASGALSSHVTATLHALGSGDSASPHLDMLPSAPVLPAPVAYHLPQQAAVNQIMQQQQAACASNAPGGAATTGGRARLGGAVPSTTSLAALVPHVPQVTPPPPPHAPAALAAAVVNSEASAPSAGTASQTKALPCMAARVQYKCKSRSV